MVVWPDVIVDLAKHSSAVAAILQLLEQAQLPVVDRSVRPLAALTPIAKSVDGVVVL